MIREDAEAGDPILRVLATHGAHDRGDTPLEPRWLEGGWSAHFEYQEGELRIRMAW